MAPARPAQSERAHLRPPASTRIPDRLPGFDRDLSRIPLQPARFGAVGQTTDINGCEREADSVAEQIMHMQAPPPHRARCGCGGGPHCASTPNTEQRPAAKVINGNVDGAGPSRASLAHVDQVVASPGQPLDRDTREFMEPRFGRDFSRVRVHTDAPAAGSAAAVNARAYTLGHHVVFGAGQYEPGTDDGRRLLAHELTHVVQQRGSLQHKIQKQSIHNPLFPCADTASLPGGMDFFGTLVHLVIQQHYVSNIDSLAATEYAIPGGGRADIVDSTGGVYEIKPKGLEEKAFIEAEEYVLAAEIACDPAVNWHLGLKYFPPPGPMIINGTPVVSRLKSPGVIIYSRVQRGPERVPVPVFAPGKAPANERKREPKPVPAGPLPVPVGPSPVPQPSTQQLILEWAKQVVATGADASTAAHRFFQQLPELAWSILLLGSAGIVVLLADDLTLAGIVDDVLIPIIGSLVRVAWEYI